MNVVSLFTRTVAPAPPIHLPVRLRLRGYKPAYKNLGRGVF